MIKGVLLDLSGTVYVGNEVLPGALEAVERLQAQNIPLRYLTNSSRSPRKTIFQKLRAMGFAIAEEEIFTAPQAIHDYLREHELSPWLLVHPAIEEEFSDLGGGTPDAVVLGDAADAFTYVNLNRAFRLLFDGARLLAVGDNRYFREADGMSLDAGPFVTALEYATGCEAIILGKPSVAFFHSAASHLGCRPEETLMVGDDVFSDINGALKAGMKAALVQTGKYRPGDEQNIIAPGACVCTDLLEAVEGIL
ncbi:MAG: hydrolase [Desulfuromonadales bacterium C00003093]|nr:MAG: hydrolase [Desulfuromonadales bacterium C00003093]